MEDRLKRILYKMILIRKFESMIGDLMKDGIVKLPMVHLYIGEESIAAVFSEVVRSCDKVVGWLRGHGWYLALGGSPYRLFCELLEREDGCASGYGGSMHVICEDKGFVGISAMVGGSIPLAVGMAYAKKLMGDPGVVFVVFGEGGTEEGVFYESLNIAALKRLPVVFVCEMNQYSVHKKVWWDRAVVEVENVAREMGVFGMASTDRVFELLEKAERARKIAEREQPVFLRVMTYRLRQHMGYGLGENEGRGTRAEEMNGWRDALTAFKGYFDPKEVERIERKVESYLRSEYERASLAREARVLW